MARVTRGPSHASSPPNTYASSPPKSHTGLHVLGSHIDTRASAAVDIMSGGWAALMATWLTPAVCACRVACSLHRAPQAPRLSIPGLRMLCLSRSWASSTYIPFLQAVAPSNRSGAHTR
jgi:hypothetical protein